MLRIFGRFSIAISQLLMLCAALPAIALELTGKREQGALLVGQTAPGNRILLDGKPVRVTSDGRFVIGFDRDAKPQATLTEIAPSGQQYQHQLQIAQRQYDIQRIEGVPQRTVTPPPEQLKRIREEAALVSRARQTDSDLLHFLAGFQWPLTGRISGVYGSQRVYNGEPGRPHFGVDIAAPTGTPVRAPADAVVTLAHPDMFFSGGTLILDHGYGVSSTFIHLSEVLVKPGDVVKTGDVVARVGATGRATGPHLDWRINWFDVRIDPTTVVPPMAEVVAKQP
jgi:murein DD-endopeptidase MepM/ murein hydrolase activator NlpD